MNKIKDGHTDVLSTRRLCTNIIEDCEQILRALPSDENAPLPTWWTNKLAVSAAYINSDRDYLVYTMQQASTDKEPDESDEDQQITINFTADEDDMSPPSAKMVRETENASEEG
tara:strand:- start:1552 stop:1893 length:342 start_codon:yes stop_codon:yes gene_type:complete